jgi:hypothetical protein
MTQARGFFKKMNLIWEANYGVTPAIASGEMVSLPFNDESLGSEEEMINPQTITGTRFGVEPAFGNISVQGAVTVPLDVRNFGYWLRMILGDPSTSGSGTYTHTFNPATTIPSASVEIGYDDITVYRPFTGVKANSMSMSFQKSIELVANIDIMGKSEAAAAGSSIAISPKTLVFDRFNAKGVSLKKGGATITTVRKVDLTIRNELATDIFCIDGTGFRHSLPETNFVVEGSIEVLFEDSTIYNEAVNGTETSLQITLASGTNSLVFDVYELKFPRKPPTSSGSAPVFLELPFIAYYQDNAQGVPFRATLINNVANY